MTLLDSGTPQAWATSHELTHPVVEVDQETARSYWKLFLGYPSVVTLHPGLVVERSGSGYWLDDEQVELVLP
ncbi:MAG: hypothetical protein B7733_24940 [Myxococcales bacterium FL481]|nr:MAG: hypothetical protein B7733_24940 [Myxococcales bacterium FL481]